MESISPKKLRAELKDYLDMASKEPIRIQRRSGENYILLSEDMYAQLQNEISTLQRRLLSYSEVLDGKAVEYKEKSDRLKRLKK